MITASKSVRAARAMAASGLLVLFSGCLTQSIQPIYDSRTLTFDEGLLGAWSDGEARWAFTASGPSAYTLLHTSDDGAMEAEAHLARLGEHVFLDLYVEDLPDGVGDLFEVVTLPLHTVFRVDVLSDELKLSSLSVRWAQEYLEANPQAAAHSFVDGRAVLTGDTEAVQEFFAAHASDPDAWEDAIDMRRLSADAAPRR